MNMTVTRRAAVASAAAAALALAGCGRPAPEVGLADAGEALGFILGALAGPSRPPLHFAVPR